MKMGYLSQMSTELHATSNRVKQFIGHGYRTSLLSRSSRLIELVQALQSHYECFEEESLFSFPDCLTGTDCLFVILNRSYDTFHGRRDGTCAMSSQVVLHTRVQTGCHSLGRGGPSRSSGSSRG
jgi:hypothetical protein